MTMEDVVQRMRGDIEVKLEGKESSFRVTYSSPEPRIAQMVTERLAALYIEENLRDREKLAENTSQFLESQLEDAKRRLIEQEKKLESYRRRYAGQLPSQLEGNLQSMQSAQMQLQALVESMNRARERRLLVERQIADVRRSQRGREIEKWHRRSPSAARRTAARNSDRPARTVEVALHRRPSRRPGAEQTVRELQAKVEEEAAASPQALPERVGVAC